MPNSFHTCAIALVVLSAAGCDQSGPRISVNAASVRRVTVATKDGVLAGFDDQARIRRLSSILNGAEPVSDHKCASCGVLTLQLTNGTSLKLDLVSGHDDENFELRQDSGMSRVSREELLNVLEMSYPFQRDPCTSTAGGELINLPASQQTEPTAP